MTASARTVARTAGSPGPDFDVRAYISGAGGLAGVANVVMQLGWPAVGYGVKESRVPSGSAMVHPLKRARTTFTYLAVALIGTEADRRAFRRAVNRQHARVRSDDHSPVAYNAFDPDLQLWVAACLYYGFADVLRRVRGPLGDAEADALYRYCSRFGTTLQVRPESWPADRQAFAAYWEQALQRVRIDDTMRDYLTALVGLRNMPRLAQVLFGPANRFWTTGFLPPPFREQMQLAWTDSREAVFQQILRRIGQVESVLPVQVRVLPFEALLMDMRLRLRLGRPLV